MVKKYQNPFKTLGIDPSLVRDLSQAQLTKFIEFHYRTLQQIHHPDHGGSREVSESLNNARDLLRDAETYEAFKKQYLARSPKLREELEAAKQEKYSMYAKWVEDMVALAIQKEGREEREKTVFDRPLSLKIYDYLRSQAGTPDFRKRQDNGYFQYKLDVSEDGVITKTYPNKEIKTHRNKQLVGTIDQETLGNRQSFARFLKQTGFNMSPTDRYRLFGIRAMDLDDITMTGSIGILSASKFMQVADLMSSQINKGSLLFAINIETGEPYFSLEGMLPFK